MHALVSKTEQRFGDSLVAIHLWVEMFIDIFQRGDNVGGAGNGFENLDSFEWIGNLVDTFQSVSVAEEDLDTFVVVVLGRVEHRG